MVSIYGPRDSKFDPIVREKEARIAALGAERDADLRAVYSKMAEKRIDAARLPLMEAL